MPKKLFIICKISNFSKKYLLFPIQFSTQKYLVSSFKIHNLEANVMYFKNIGDHFA